MSTYMSIKHMSKVPRRFQNYYKNNRINNSLVMTTMSISYIIYNGKWIQWMVLSKKVKH